MVYRTTGLSATLSWEMYHHSLNDQLHFWIFKFRHEIQRDQGCFPLWLNSHVSQKSVWTLLRNLSLYWNSWQLQWPCHLLPVIWALRFPHSLIHCKCISSDHLFSNYFPVPASRKLSALVMWAPFWVCNQGRYLKLRTFSYPLKKEGRVNYYPAELIGFCRGWFRFYAAYRKITPKRKATLPVHCTWSKEHSKN